jgi:hypothetical protein
MTEQVDKWPAGDIEKGLSIRAPDFGAEFSFDDATYNVSESRYFGIGPRYGMAPIPGQVDAEVAAGTTCNNMRGSEATSGGVGLVKRELLLGVVPISFGTYDDITVQRNHYLWLYTADTYFDVSFGSTFVSSVYKYQADIASGLAAGSWRAEGTLERRYKTELLSLPLSATTADMQKYFTLPAGQKWLPSCTMTVSGRDVPMKYMLGKVVTAPDATHAPELNFWRVTGLSQGGAHAQNVNGGSPAKLFTNNMTSDKRKVTVTCLGSYGEGLQMIYTVDVVPATHYVQGITNYGTGAQTAFHAATQVKLGAGTSYSSAVAALVNDEAMVTNSAYKAVLIAGKKPVAMILQDWVRQTNGIPAQWVDLTRPACMPRDAVGTYSDPEGGQQLPTAFAFGAGTLGNVFQLSNAEAGILSNDTTYEFGFSYFNKRLDYETNVSASFKYAVSSGTPAQNNFAIIIANSDWTNGNSWFRTMTATADHLCPWEWGDASITNEDPRNLSINDYEIRFYYRQLGMAEWLPAGFWDAAQLWFGGYSGRQFLCASPIAGLPGGRPGGFIDYSPLPDLQYNCVVNYKNRAWWFSESACYYSLRDNLLAYPARNSLAAPTGKFRGGIVHSQLDQAQSTSRLIIFGSDQTYVARFTGNKETVPVQISADTTAEFELDGSDLDIDFHTDGTAYSYRAAIVAEGVLHWWGQQGVYRDDGRDLPRNITRDMEPDIFNWVDPSKIDEVHAVYNSQTKEIIWFYPPRDADGYATHGLALNVLTGDFYPLKWKGKVDSTCRVKVERDDSNTALGGERTVAICRGTTSDTVSRGYYMDQVCRSGDFFPKMDMVVKSFTTPSSGLRRLTLAAGYDAANFATIAVGDQICLQQLKKYATTLTLGDDMIGQVAALGSGTIDITVPTTASIDASATLTRPTYFPIWHGGPKNAAGISSFPFVVRTSYWMPNGVNYSGYWMFLYMMMKLTRLPSVAAQLLSLAWKTPTAAALITDSIALVDNSDGNMQILHQLRPDSAGNEGQAMRFQLSGNHLGSEWVLQYMEAHVKPEITDILKTFEG